MTLTEFKRMAREKPIALELLWRFGATKFVPWLRDELALKYKVHYLAN